MKRYISPDTIFVAAISFIAIGLQGRRLDLLEANASLQAHRNEPLEEDISGLTNKINTLRSRRKLQNEVVLDIKAMNKDNLMIKKSIESIEARMDAIEESSAREKVDRSLVDLPFQKVGDWWVADNTMFQFPKGIVIGKKNTHCEYGDAVLSVDYGWEGEAVNCPSGHGSVAFGLANQATGDFATVTGGKFNVASGFASVLMGGRLNEVTGDSSAVIGGELNKATGTYAAVLGGDNNEAAGWSTAVAGGGNNKAYGSYSVVTGGQNNNANGDSASVTGGDSNDAKGDKSSIAGGNKNTVEEDGSYSSIGGGYMNVASEQYAVVAKDSIDKAVIKRIETLEEHSPFTCDADRCVSDKKTFRFTSDIKVKGKIHQNPDHTINIGN
mmetsp:Transcript_2350/g.4564  ORF Transcript_2350/g.4564 Transcript_2350/m.4564 type:complete len:383 (-) Transcript_2350:84-1232(-)